MELNINEKFLPMKGHYFLFNAGKKKIQKVHFNRVQSSMT